MADIAQGIREAFKALGSNDAQVADAPLVMADQVAVIGGVVCLSATGTALTSDESKAWLQATKPHLLPPVYQVNDADTAFCGVGNKTIAQKLIRELGKERADEISRTYGKAHALDNKPGVAPQGEQTKSNANGSDHAKNPWSKAGWNITRQGQLVKSLGVAKAAELARSVSSHIGATKASM